MKIRGIHILKYNLKDRSTLISDTTEPSLLSCSRVGGQLRSLLLHQFSGIDRPHLRPSASEWLVCLRPGAPRGGTQEGAREPLEQAS